ncbi:MAG: hypothetical protein JKY48_18795 [Flavobacteriales bacterium]|nr:hypothetical protein [Flavobacteriales bacterium]
MEIYPSTELSFPTLLHVNCFGHLVHLMAIYTHKKGLLFTVDAEKQKKKKLTSDFSSLSDEDQQKITNGIEQDKQLKKQLNAKETDTGNWKDKLLKLLTRVEIENIALYWDLKKTTILYLTVKLNLKDTLSLFDGAISLEYLKLDLILSSGKVITEPDRKRKKEIEVCKEEMKGEYSKFKTLDKLSKTLTEKHKFKEKIQKKFGQKEKQFSSLQKKLERKEKLFSTLQNKLRAKQKTEVQEIGLIDRQIVQEQLEQQFQKRELELEEINQATRKRVEQMETYDSLLNKLNQQELEIQDYLEINKEKVNALKDLALTDLNIE